VPIKTLREHWQDSCHVTPEIRERTFAGLKAARVRGRKGGRPRKLSEKDLKTVRATLTSGEIPVSTVAAQFRVSRSTLYRNVGVSP
jgi:DNA invertase Pin-like site-specific DNA recombinase